MPPVITMNSSPRVRLEVGPNEEGFHHAKEHIGRGREPLLARVEVRSSNQENPEQSAAGSANGRGAW
jgi:hypothetical protein